MNDDAAVGSGVIEEGHGEGVQGVGLLEAGVSFWHFEDGEPIGEGGVGPVEESHAGTPAAGEVGHDVPVDVDTAIVHAGERVRGRAMAEGSPGQDLVCPVDRVHGDGAVGEQHGRGAGVADWRSGVRDGWAAAGAGGAGHDGVVVVFGEGDTALRWRLVHGFVTSHLQKNEPKNLGKNI